MEDFKRFNTFLLHQKKLIVYLSICIILRKQTFVKLSSAHRAQFLYEKVKMGIGG